MVMYVHMRVCVCVCARLRVQTYAKWEALASTVMILLFTKQR